MSVSISKTLSSKIKAVSFLCTVLIVLLHAYEQSLVSESNHCSIYVAKFLSLGVCEMATPFFFIISGFLLACQYDGGVSYSQLWKRRLFSLGKPYVYWCIIYALIYVVFNVLCNHLAGRALNENTCLVMPLYSWENPFRVLNPFRILGFDLFEFPVNGPLWYVRNLFFLVLLSSVLMAVMKTKARGQIFIALVFVLYMVHFTIPSPWHKFFQTGFSFRGLLFFSIGIYLVVMFCLAAIGVAMATLSQSGIYRPPCFDRHRLYSLVEHLRHHSMARKTGVMAWHPILFFHLRLPFCDIEYLVLQEGMRFDTTAYHEQRSSDLCGAFRRASDHVDGHGGHS